MEDLDTSRACMAVDEGFLDFALEGEGEDEESHVTAEAAFRRQSVAGSFPEMVEEELEWLSNKDAFPSVETCFGILADNPELVLNHQSPVSVLENSSTSSNTNSNGACVASCCNSLKVPVNYPVRARSKRRRRRAGVGYLASPESWLNQVNAKNRHESSFALSPLPTVSSSGGGSMGRRCLHCQTDKTPQWRAGPMGPKTLCNACGVRYKSGRLLPEYRPANSPTFSSVLHSNSHRKVVEMRRQKQGVDGVEIPVNVGCGYSVG